MQLMIDLDTESEDGLRFAAEMLLRRAELIRITDERASETPRPVKIPAPPAAPQASNVPPPPPSEGNVLNFPVPPPPPMATAPALVTNAGALPPSSAATSLAGTGNSPPPPPSTQSSASSDATSVASTSSAGPTATLSPTEFDKSGMPFDARIHQKSRNQKKDGTWKIQKGIDQALLQSVVAELASKRLTPNAAPSPLSGRPSSESQAQMPLVVPPPPASVPPVPNVPPPPVDVPPPPAGTSEPATGVTFRQLLDKITEGTKAGKLDPMKVAQIVQSNGAPNITSLKGMAHLIPAVSEAIDLALLGLA